eukprot:c13987_g1_i1 orf=3-383(-)
MHLFLAASLQHESRKKNKLREIIPRSGSIHTKTQAIRPVFEASYKPARFHSEKRETRRQRAQRKSQRRASFTTTYGYAQTYKQADHSTTPKTPDCSKMDSVKKHAKDLCKPYTEGNRGLTLDSRTSP